MPGNEQWVDAHNLALYLVREKNYSPELADRLAPQIVANPQHPDRPFYTDMLRRDQQNQRTSDAVYNVVEQVGDPYIQQLTASKNPSEQELGFAAYHREQRRRFPELAAVQDAATAPLQFRDSRPMPDFTPIVKTADHLVYLGVPPEAAMALTRSLYSPVINHPVTQALLARGRNNY